MREHLAWALVACVTLTGCSAFSKAGQGIADIGAVVKQNSEVIGDIVGKVQGFADEAKARYELVADKVDELDADQDGSISMEEMLIGLGALGGAVFGRNKLSDRRKTKTEERLVKLEASQSGPPAAS